MKENKALRIHYGTKYRFTKEMFECTSSIGSLTYSQRSEPGCGGGVPGGTSGSGSGSGSGVFAFLPDFDLLGDFGEDPGINKFPNI